MQYTGRLVYAGTLICVAAILRAEETSTVGEVFSEHWSFQPVERPEIPKTKAGKWSQNDGRTVTLDDSELPPEKRPVRPFTGRLADKTFRQRDYQSSLDPIRQEGRFLPPEDKVPAPRQ